ncbi:DUF1566 domain-containing protein [Aliarcobacter cryaerophilus]|uniref:Lcl domain-containing protein n=1 Tax=Aliarcobacter cryaerophilus TaxID=28198 RepID=UPI0021B3B2F3|nr:DUF1566 domain-containing protein [Aliarcobacter cryaerophilus]MCT7523190.1 DUF1566 domain-containing protein [Aliarcobacter cryaerophilus]
MKRVFIASRFEEFREIREKLKKELLDCNLFPIDLNDNNAVSHAPLARSLQNVNESDIVVLLIGDTYGEPPKGQEKSYTHLEYEEAIKNKIPVYPFAIGKSYINNQILFSENKNFKIWQKQLEDKHTLSMFNDDSDIGLIVHKIVTSIYNIENKTWLDEETGLMWQVKIDASEEHGRLPWNDIFKYCDHINKENFGGFNDWRIPTIEELETLLINDPHPNCYGYDEKSFIKKPLLYSMSMRYGRFWSCTSNHEDYNFAYGINFNRKRENSQSKRGKKEKYKTRYVRCVRLWRDDDIEKEWIKIKDSRDINIIKNFVIKFPNSKFQNVINEIIIKNELEEKKYINSLNKVERKLLTLKNHSNIPKATLLFNAIKDGMFDDIKFEALSELKNIMIKENLWKENSNAKNSNKDKNYLRTLEIINLMAKYG